MNRKKMFTEVIVQKLTAKTEVFFVVEVPAGKPHTDYTEEAIQAAIRDCAIFLDGKECEPVKLFVDYVNVEIEDVEEAEI